MQEIIIACNYTAPCQPPFISQYRLKQMIALRRSQPFGYIVPVIKLLYLKEISICKAESKFCEPLVVHGDLITKSSITSSCHSTGLYESSKLTHWTTYLILASEPRRSGRVNLSKHSSRVTGGSSSLGSLSTLILLQTLALSEILSPLSRWRKYCWVK